MTLGPVGTRAQAAIATPAAITSVARRTVTIIKAARLLMETRGQQRRCQEGCPGSEHDGWVVSGLSTNSGRRRKNSTPLRYARAMVAVSRWLDPWMRNRLFRKYVVPFVAVVSGALLTNGLVEIYFTYQESRAQLAQIQREKASAAALRIEQFVREIERQMGWTTQPQVVAAPGALEQRQIDYVRLLRQVPAITEVAFLDGRGREQLRISRLAMDVVAGGADV